MNSSGFRRIALSMPDVVEASHVGHPDFRVGGKVFATLGYPNARWAMVKLKPEQQATLVAAKPDVFTPVAGGWGRKGSIPGSPEPLRVREPRLHNEPRL